MSDVEVVVFDLGGVIYPIRLLSVFETWAEWSGRDAADVETRFRAYRHGWAFERGEISADEFRRGVNEQLGTALPDEVFDRGWNALYQPPHPGIEDTLGRLRERCRIAALSNTNEIHQRSYTPLYAETLGLFERVLTSHELGMRKPEARIYRAALEALGVPAERSLFIDDKASNVEAAREVGMDAFVAASRPEIDAGLMERGLL